MSKRSRAIAQAKRRGEKFKRKQQKKALYASFAEHGRSKGSKRLNRKKKKIVNSFKKPKRNRRTTYDVEVVQPDGSTNTVRKGGTITLTRRKAEKLFGTKRACAKRNR